MIYGLTALGRRTENDMTKKPKPEPMQQADADPAFRAVRRHIIPRTVAPIRFTEDGMPS
jgi:hypothetical protein